MVVRAQAKITLALLDDESSQPLLLKKVRYGVSYAGTVQPESPPHAKSSDVPFDSVTLTVECDRLYDFVVVAPGYSDGHLKAVEIDDKPTRKLVVRLRRRP